tara:strand:+ start:21 stop:389 length:369 start_codon:yes stop_codon:yes gene_type:complete
MIFIQFSKYLFIGVTSLVIDFVIYYFFSVYLNFDINYSKAISFVGGSVNSYILNKKKTFYSVEKGIKEPLKFSFIYISSLLVNYFSHKYLINYYGNYLPFLISTSLSAIINFTGLKFFVFKK